jgi:hypothetical protein
MKSVSIVAIAIFALVAVCSSIPIVNQKAELEALARFDVYNDFLSGLFSGLVQTTFGSVSGFINQLITENPLNIGKRDAEDDVTARINALSFLYDNILQDLFSGLVTNTFGSITSTLNNLIQTNPLNIGKRDAEDDVTARINALSFLYDNILQDLFSGLVTNTFGSISNTLNHLIQTNPLNIGKRAAGINIFQFLQENNLADLFGGLASSTANYLQNSLQTLLNKPLGIGKRSVSIEQAQTIIVETISTLVQKFKTFATQAVAAAVNDRQKLVELVKNTIADIKATVAQLAQQLSQLIPSAIANEVTEILALLQSTLVFWTSGLGGSLGPVIGPFSS